MTRLLTFDDVDLNSVLASIARLTGVVPRVSSLGVGEDQIAPARDLPGTQTQNISI